MLNSRAICCEQMRTGVDLHEKSSERAGSSSCSIPLHSLRAEGGWVGSGRPPWWQPNLHGEQQRQLWKTRWVNWSSKACSAKSQLILQGLASAFMFLEQRIARACARHRYHSSFTAKVSSCSAALPGTEAGVVFGPCRDQDKIPEDSGKDVERQRKSLWSEKCFWLLPFRGDGQRGWGAWPPFPVLLFYLFPSQH